MTVYYCKDDKPWNGSFLERVELDGSETVDKLIGMAERWESRLKQMEPRLKQWEPLFLLAFGHTDDRGRIVNGCLFNFKKTLLLSGFRLEDFDATKYQHVGLPRAPIIVGDFGT